MIFPLDALPLIITSEKSTSHFNFFNLELLLKLMVIFSASPFGLAEKYLT